MADTHVDIVTSNMDGSIGITMSLWMNPVVAASFEGAVVAGTVVNAGGGEVKAIFTISPGSPIAQGTIGTDAGGSDSSD